MSLVRDLYKGETTEELVGAVDYWRSREDLPDLSRATSRLRFCECGRVGELPDHETCHGQEGHGPCWRWTGCDDPDCEHPACSGRGAGEFSAWWEEQDYERVLTIGHEDRIVAWASPWVPWPEHGRNAELLAEHEAGEFRSGTVKEVDPAKMLRALERGPIYPVKLGDAYLDMELALAASGLSLEERTVAETDDFSVAFVVARRLDSDPDGIGGTILHELRLAAPLDLEQAPDGYQGGLFV